jgi:hypothetical protein
MLKNDEKFTLKFFFILLFICMAVALVFSGCDSFKPVKQEVLSEYPECVVMLNAGEIYKGDKDKSGTVSPVTKCLDSIKRQRCAMEVFNKQVDCNGKKIYVVDWGADKDRMNQYNECLLK